jgi:hypothetical protein
MSSQTLSSRKQLCTLKAAVGFLASGALKFVCKLYDREMTLHTTLGSWDRHVFGSVWIPLDPHVFTWILQIRIHIGNADPDSEPGARKLTKISKSA